VAGHRNGDRVLNTNSESHLGEQREAGSVPRQSRLVRELRALVTDGKKQSDKETILARRATADVCLDNADVVIDGLFRLLKSRGELPSGAQKRRLCQRGRPKVYRQNGLERRQCQRFGLGGPLTIRPSNLIPGRSSFREIRTATRVLPSIPGPSSASRLPGPLLAIAAAAPTRPAAWVSLEFPPRNGDSSRAIPASSPLHSGGA